MGKENVTTLRYFENNEHFAELVNGIIFHGRKIIDSQKLKSMNRDLLYPWTKKGKELYRDSVKKYCNKAIVQIFALEHQEYIDYHMVFRNMLAEALEYDRQWQERKKLHRQNKDLKQRDEYLSGMTKDDKFIPVITLVIYYGEEKWNAPTSLHELMDFNDADEHLRGLVENYHIHVFDYHDYDNFKMFCGELGKVFSFLKHSGNKDMLRKHLAEHQNDYYNISNDTCELISAITHTQELLEMKQLKKEGVNMCRAFDEMKLEGEMTQLVRMVCKKIIRGKSVEEAADELETDFSLIKEFYDIALSYGPDYDCDKIYQQWEKMQKVTV